jgi:hypothetical protein
VDFTKKYSKHEELFLLFWILPACRQAGIVDFGLMGQ